MKTKLFILTAVAATLISSTFAGENGGGKKQKSRPNPEKMIARMIENNDGNKDSALDAAELEQALIQIHERRKERMAKMRQKFGDREGKGPRAEGRKRPAPTEAAEHLILEFDFDDNGSLDANELLEAMGSLRERGPRRHDGPPPPDVELEE